MKRIELTWLSGGKQRRLGVFAKEDVPAVLESMKRQGSKNVKQAEYKK